MKNKEHTKEDKSESNFINKGWIVLWIIIALLLITISVVAYIYLSHKNFTSERLGQIGDYFGGILNPTLAFLSFVALLTTIFLQGEELKATREELSRSAAAQEKSEKTFRKQQFESTFFSILNQINIFINIFTKESRNTDEDKHEIGRNNIIIEWKKILDSTYEENEFYKSLPNPYKQQTSKYKIDFHAYIRQINDHEKSIQRISILIYQLLKLIEQEKSYLENPKMYANIVRACIDNELMQILFIYWAREDLESMKKYKKLVENYAFLEHMTFRLLNETSPSPLLRIVRQKYDISAFGNSDYLQELLAFEASIEENEKQG